MNSKKSLLMGAKFTILVGVLTGLTHLAFAAVETRVRTFIHPPTPLPAGVAAHGGARVEYRARPGDREELRLDVEDVEVIGDPADAAFCMGFYELVLIRNGSEVILPEFTGILVVCDIAGNPQGETTGELDFKRSLSGDATLDFSGTTIQIWEVEVARNPLTGEVLPGPNEEPFIILERKVKALEGTLN